MIKHFADWMRLVNVEPSDGLLKTRWGSIEALDKAAPVADVPELVRLYRARPASAAFLTRFENAFQGPDTAFSLKSSGAMIQVLAGTALARIMTKGDPRADLAALALDATSRWNLSAQVLQELEIMAQTRLNSRGREVRTVDPNPFGNEEEKALKKALDGVTAKWNADPAAMKEPMDAFTAQVLKALSAINVSFTNAIRYQREETDVLWWLFGSASRDQRRAFSEIGARAIPLVAAKELGDLTATTPGLPAANAFLQRAIELAGTRADAPVALLDAVNALDRALRQEWAQSLNNGRLADLSPVSAAVNSSVSVPHDDQWSVSFQTQSGVDPKTPWPTIDLAQQFYSELLLSRKYAALSKS